MKYLWLLALIPTTAFALSYETDSLIYSDNPSDLETQVAISTLTEIGVLTGNPDGTIRPNAYLNRAEFVAMVERLLPEDNIPHTLDCFPDVHRDAWYASSACHLKSLGIIRGNALEGLTPNQYPFAPERNVTYEEALKILTGIFNVPVTATSGEWYEKYVQVAEDLRIHLKDSHVGAFLTRGQMARLTVSYLAYSHGELDELWAAQTNASKSSVSSSSSSTSSLASSVSSASSVAIYDHMLYDTTTDDAILILGNVTHILGAASLFADAEGILVDEFLIDLVAANTSLEAMNVYDDRGKFLGRATLDASVAGGKRYRLAVKSSQNIQLPRRDDFSFYVRGVLRPEDQGGTSGGSIEVDEMGIKGIGVWSNRDYQEWTSGETFAESTVSRSAISEIRNASDDSAVLSAGTDMELGSFFFAGATGHSSAEVRITAIDFTLGVTGGTTVTNPILRVSGSSDTHACSIASSTITCASLPAVFGQIDDGTRTLRLYGDITVPASSQGASVQLSINDPGSIGAAGDITWTDGETTFTWIDLNTRPVARSTYYSY